MFFVFFQAEDGIRDLIVTGVQTCALPIYQASLHAERERKIGRLKEILPFPYNTEIGVRAGVYVDQVVDETIGEAYRAVMERFALLRAAEPGLNPYYSKSAKRSWQTQSREGGNGTATMAEQPDYDPDYRPK